MSEVVFDDMPKAKKPSFKKGLIIFLLAIVAIGLLNSFYFVNEGEYAIIKRFDKVVDIVEEPGLNFKAPFIDTKSSLTKRLEFYDVSPSDVITKDKKSMIVDTYSVWRIKDPLTFLQKAGSVSEIERRLEASIYGSLKTTIGELNQMDIIASRTNNSINEAILMNSKDSIESYGVELVDVQIKKFDLPASNKNAVFDRMISERNQIVATYLAEGEEEANKIRYTADKEKEIIVSKAQAEAAQLEAEGEREYMKILSSAYNTRDRAEFYEFIRGLDAVKTSLKGDKTVIMSDESTLSDILNGSNKGSSTYSAPPVAE
ncbi:protease modulator HflC [Tyzzerella sp. OttesenSCG-928-J15]|nr:protease modulator HflC [Tyzzerella sp. OttesenSCG-928-J15]